MCIGGSDSDAPTIVSTLELFTRFLACSRSEEYSPVERLEFLLEAKYLSLKLSELIESKLSN